MALAAQGFDRPRPEGTPDIRHVRAVARRLGLIQLDYVNVLVPAHYMVPFSRIGPYDRSKLDELVYRRRELTEQWAHEASLVMMELWPLLEDRRRGHRARPHAFVEFIESHPDYVASALELVREQGPVLPEALPEPPGPDRVGHEWFRSVRRCVLEAHFGRGRLAVARRKANFARVYELTERVVPARHREQRVDREESHRRLLTRAARAHGVATAGDLADYWRMPMGDVRPRLAELLEEGVLQGARVEGWREPAYLHPHARLPRSVNARALLSPFDPLVWTRPRMQHLWDMDYRLEIFVPAARRRWGYYVLPFLLGDRLVARVDLKADRGGRRLLVRAAYREPHADETAVAPALALELRTMARWLDLGEIDVASQGDFAPALRSAVQANN